MTTNELEVYELEADNWWSSKSKMSILNSFNPPRFDYFNNFIKDWKGLKVLDVGCGGGFTSEYLAEKDANVYGIDMSSKLIKVAKDHSQSRSLDIDYRQGAAENLPFGKETFDVVVCVDVLEHVSDLRRVIFEISRVLKNNGVFLFDTVNKTEESKFVMITILEDTLNEIPKGSHDWNKFIEPERLKSLLTDKGFEEIEFKGFEAKDKDENTGFPKIEINDNTSVMYIGKAVFTANDYNKEKVLPNK